MISLWMFMLVRIFMNTTKEMKTKYICTYIYIYMCVSTSTVHILCTFIICILRIVEYLNFPKILTFIV